MVSKPWILCKALPTGPRWTLIALRWLLVGLVTQTDWIDVITVFILIVYKICGSSKLNNLSFVQNNLINNLILFCKYLSPRKLHRNGFVFKICIWISVFWRRKQFENLILSCWDIKQKPSLILFGTLYNRNNFFVSKYTGCPKKNCT